jgi:hypothetical protein
MCVVNAETRKVYIADGVGVHTFTYATRPTTRHARAATMNKVTDSPSTDIHSGLHRAREMRALRVVVVVAVLSRLVSRW